MTRRFRNETALREALVERVQDDWRGVVFVTSATGRSHVVGQPDLICCVAGRCVQVEVKMPGKRPTPAQYGRMRRWQDAGALVGWVTSLEELDELLRHVADPTWRNPLLEPGVGVRQIDLTGD